MTAKKEKKKTKADKIVQLLLEAQNPAHIGFTNKELADHLECSISYVWKIRKAVEERLRPDEALPVHITDEIDPTKVGDYVYELTKGSKPPKEGTYTRSSVLDTAKQVMGNVYTRSSVLDTAKQYVTEDREATHGNMEDNFEAIATLWNQYFDCERSFSPIDVAVMMALLKIARLKSNKDNPDNYIDTCGYMACAGELALRKVVKK